MLALLIELCFMLALPDWSVTCACPTWLKCDLCLPYLSEVWPVLALPVWGVACACPTCLRCGLCLPYLTEMWPVLAQPDWGVACACPTWLRYDLCLPYLRHRTAPPGTQCWPGLHHYSDRSHGHRSSPPVCQRTGSSCWNWDPPPSSGHSEHWSALHR